MYKIIKRLIDLIVVLLVTILLLPLLIPIFIALKLTAEGEVFYGQDRMGLNNKIFKILKFATMLKNSPNMGSQDVTLRNDPRVTTIGKFLRMTKMNEIPQVFNVLMGDMSLVGPRPLMPVSFTYYAPHVQDVVYKSIPGITGIGSLVFRDEEKLVSYQKEYTDPRDYYRYKIYPYKGELELWYQKNKSTYTDLMIIFLTAYSIIFKDNKLVYTIFKTLPESPFK